MGAEVSYKGLAGAFIHFPHMTSAPFATMPLEVALAALVENQHALVKNQNAMITVLTDEIAALRTTVESLNNIIKALNERIVKMEAAVCQ